MITFHEHGMNHHTHIKQRFLTRVNFVLENGMILNAIKKKERRGIIIKELIDETQTDIKDRSMRSHKA